MAIAPTLAEVDRISALRDPLARNLRITQCYYELSEAVRARTGPGANWCTFATWASKQAGQTIRKEDLARAIEAALTRSRSVQRAAADAAALAARAAHPRAGARSLLDALNPLASIARASDAVARGNRKVFAEIGREFARFAATCLDDRDFDIDRIAAFCAELRDGDPPDGQRYLRQAFTRYYHALFARDAKRRAELLLHANLEIGLHEQTRLQPEIQAAMQASALDPDPLARRALAALFPTRGEAAFDERRARRALGQPSQLDQALDEFLSLSRAVMRKALTAAMMTLWVPPDRRLRLGRDLPAEFPPRLRRIADPELRALLGQIDPTPNSVSGTGAGDWADLGERLHFIADLFRCYHESTDLRAPPFTPDQVAALKAGRRPEGRL